ncbi:hypothetical protein ACSBR2_006918 [Camellia fascicularis]
MAIVWIVLNNFGIVKLVAQSLLLGLYLQVLAVFAVDVHRLNIWPMPQSVSNGHQILHMSKDFELMTQGTNYPDASGILKDGFSRLLDVVQAAHVVDGNFSHFDQSVLLQGIHVVIFSLNDELQYGIDESYKLSIPAGGNPVYAHLEAQTVYGALHGLQTFSQLCHFNFTTRVIEVHQVPWNIIDQPRFSYRGLLIDTSRHYQPLPMIKKVIDSMAYAKLIPNLSLWRYLHIPNYVMLRGEVLMYWLKLMFQDMLSPGGLVILSYGRQRIVSSHLISAMNLPSK